MNGLGWMIYGRFECSDVAIELTDNPSWIVSKTF